MSLAQALLWILLAVVSFAGLCVAVCLLVVRLFRNRNLR